MKGGFKKQKEVQFKYEWRNTNPMVKERVEFVQSSIKRKRKLDQVSLAMERQQVITTQRHKLRENNINEIMLTRM